VADAVTEQEARDRGSSHESRKVLWVPSAGDLLEASFDNMDDVGTFAGRDEPAELSYDYVEGDRRAVEVLRRVVEEEGGELDPKLELSSPARTEHADSSGSVESPR